MELQLPYLHLTLILLIITSSSYLQPVTASIKHDYSTDLDALLTFRAQADPLGLLASSWASNITFCSWYGVYCNRQRVTAINLSNIALQGTISPHLGNLSFLSDLILPNGSLTGPIPESIGYLRRLTHIALQDNSLTGPIPSSFFNMSSLVTLDVGYNNLSGSLPSNNNSFPMLPRLRNISLSSNRFTGDVLPSFLQCWDIQQIFLDNNLFSGSIPAGIGTLYKLSGLYLGGNKLTGTIPSSLGNLTELADLKLQRNNLLGIIPEELGNLVNLQRLILNENGGIVGSIPTSLLNLSILNFLELGGNSLTGYVPSGIGNSLPMLKWFNVGNNQLSGGLEFLSSLSNCKNLEHLQIQNNSLEGVFPDDVGNLSTNLLVFNAFLNRINGNIPITLYNLSGLIALDLTINELTGTMSSAISRLESLQSLSLLGNNISGLIPSELGLIKNLNSLFLGYNKFFGPVPEFLANISMLQYLSLANNKFSANIPKKLCTLANLMELDLSGNNLNGFIPSQVGYLKALTSLDLSMNQLSGNITDNLGELPMLTDLDLSKNSFRGQISESFKGLISVTSINLSHNYLSGPIPNSLANLPYLYSVDLSFNMLEGQVPKGRVFLNSSIPSLIGNKALCGAPQLQISACEDPVRKDSRRKLLPLKYILLVTMLCVALLAIFCLMYAFYSRRKLESLPDVNLFHMGYYKVITHHELVRATENFSEANLIGSGGFGSVFRGCLDDGLVVAIKVLNLDIEGSSTSFEAECQVLRMVRHKNLIKIISVCSNLDFKALILEYMSNGSLERWLYSDNYFLNLIQRLNIMVDVSLALEYLHHHHPYVVLHCDLKPTNILLDGELLARVSDFGIAKLLIDDSRSTTTASMPGTIGYIAPEYATTGTTSRMGDVYSFGILILETFTGKKPANSMYGEQSSLREWICKSNTILDIVDKNILKYHSTDNDLQKLLRCLSSVIELGIVCSKYSPKERIPMKNVTVKLQEIKIEYLSS